MATATIPTTDPTTGETPIARLAAAIDRRPINKFRLARDLRMSNPWYIYKILKGERPIPANFPNFIEMACAFALIPLSEVLDPEEYRARLDALSYEMTIEDLDPRERDGY